MLDKTFFLKCNYNAVFIFEIDTFSCTLLTKISLGQFAPKPCLKGIKFFNSNHETVGKPIDCRLGKSIHNMIDLKYL